MDLLADEHGLLGAQIKRGERELRLRLLPRLDVQRLVWIPGVGAITAYPLVLESDDMRRFPTARHFHSYCRLVPGADNSGGKTRHKRSRDGNRYLKLAFHHARGAGDSVRPGDQGGVSAGAAAEGARASALGLNGRPAGAPAV